LVTIAAATVHWALWVIRDLFSQGQVRVSSAVPPEAEVHGVGYARAGFTLTLQSGITPRRDRSDRRLMIGAPPIRMVSASLKCATTRAMGAFDRVADVAGRAAIKDRRKKMGQQPVVVPGRLRSRHTAPGGYPPPSTRAGHREYRPNCCTRRMVRGRSDRF
jgi:hypothetical protein